MTLNQLTFKSQFNKINFFSLQNQTHLNYPSGVKFGTSITGYSLFLVLSTLKPMAHMLQSSIYITMKEKEA